MTSTTTKTPFRTSKITEGACFPTFVSFLREVLSSKRTRINGRFAKAFRVPVPVSTSHFSFQYPWDSRGRSHVSYELLQLGLANTQSYQILVRVRLARTYVVVSAFGTLGTREDSVISAFRTLGTREYSVISAHGTRLFQFLAPLGLARTQSFQLMVSWGPVRTQSFQLPVPWELRTSKMTEFQ